jgi:hypothetical protein
MQNRAATEPPATTYTVWHRVSIGGDWVGLAVQHLSKEQADDRAGALMASGSKNVMLLAESNGVADTPTNGQMLEMNTLLTCECLSRLRTRPPARTKSTVRCDVWPCRRTDTASPTAWSSGDPSAL